MLEEIKTMTTKSFKHGSFIVDIVETPEEFDIWLHHQGYGIKVFAFGLPKTQTRTEEDCMEVVKMNINFCECDYIDDYMDGTFDGE